MRLVYLPLAEAELDEAVGYYEAIEIGLGLRLNDEVARTLASIQSDPLLWRQRPEGFRRVNLRDFNHYYIAYSVREDTVLIVAVGHGAREPNDFRDRLQSALAGACGLPNPLSLAPSCLP